MQAIKKKSVTIYGTGMQTRSFQYVSDLIQGLVLAMSNEYHFPLNIGNPYEITVLQLCDLIEQKIGYTVEKVYLELPKDDPQRRKPDIQRAKNILGWEPVVDIQTGIQKTMDSFLSDPVTISGNHFVSN
jgi:nucleoside-diphosphate-sugar epimerase